MIVSALAAITLSWLQVPGGSWNVDEATAAHAKIQLELALWDETRASGADMPTWSSYTFQLQGRTIDGRKLVFINAFCSTPPETATTEWVFVLDEGKCYFDTYYYPEKKRVLSIRFNGVS